MSHTTDNSDDIAVPHLILSDATSPGPTTPKIIRIDKDEVKIGRQPEMVDVLLDSAAKPTMISRVHAKLLRVNIGGAPKIKLVDNKSTNGLIVNGMKIEEAILSAGDTVIFGGAHIKVPLGTAITKPLSDLVYTLVDPIADHKDDLNKTTELDGTQPYAEQEQNNNNNNSDETQKHGSTTPQLTPVNSSSNMKDVAALQKQATIPITQPSLRTSGSDLTAPSSLPSLKAMGEWTVSEVADWCATIIPNNDELREKIKSSNIDGNQLKTLDERNLGEILGITKFVLKRKLSLAIKKALTQPIMPRTSSNSNLDNSPSNDDTTPKSKEGAALASTPEKKEVTTSPLSTPMMSPIKADNPDVDSTLHYSVPEQPATKKRKLDETEPTTEVTPPAKRLKSSMDMSREDICRVALAAVDPVTLGRKVWLKPGVNKLDGKFLGLSDPGLNTVQAWLIHSANKGFLGTHLAVVGTANSQVLQFETGKMISVSKGQKILLKTGDIIYLIEERHPFMLLHVPVNETAKIESHSPSSSISNELPILEDSKIVLSPNTSNTNTAPDASIVNDSMVVEPNLSAVTVPDNNNESIVAPAAEKQTPAASEEKQDVEMKTATELLPKEKLDPQAAFALRMEKSKQKILASPIHKAISLLDMSDFITKYAAPLTSPPPRSLFEPSTIPLSHPQCYWTASGISAVHRHHHSTSVCCLWLADNIHLKFNCQLCVNYDSACQHLIFMIDLFKKEPHSFQDLEEELDKLEKKDAKQLYSHLRYFANRSPNIFQYALHRGPKHLSIAPKNTVVDSIKVKIPRKSWYSALEELLYPEDADDELIPDSDIMAAMEAVVEKIKLLPFREATHALLEVYSAFHDYNRVVSVRAHPVVMDMIFSLFESYFGYMDQDLQKETLDFMTESSMSIQTDKMKSFLKKLEASCSWDNPALVSILAGNAAEKLDEPDEIVQYRIDTMINQEKYTETENYARAFNLPFVQAQMQARTERIDEAMETAKKTLDSVKTVLFPDVYRLMTIADMFAETDINKSIELFVYIQQRNNLDLTQKSIVISPILAHAGLLNEQELQQVITLIPSVGFTLQQIADLFKDSIAHPCAFKNKQDLSVASVQGKLLARECLFKPFREAKFEETRSGIDSIFAAATHFLPEYMDKIALLCFEKSEEVEALFHLITILQDKYKDKVNSMTILELYNKCFMKLSKNPTPVVDLVKQEKTNDQPFPPVNLNKFYSGYLKQISLLPFEQLTAKLPITTQLIASTVQDQEILINVAHAVGTMNHEEKKIDFYLKDCAVALITAALKIIIKNSTTKPKDHTLSINLTGKCNCRACTQLKSFALDPVAVTFNLAQTADHFRNNNMDPLMMKFIALNEARTKAGYVVTASKLVGSYNNYTKSQVRQYEAAIAKKGSCIKWLMLWTYQSQVALAYISAYPSDPEIIPQELVEEMLSKVCLYTEASTYFEAAKFFVEHKEEEAAITLAQKAISTTGTNKLDVMNYIEPICVKLKGARMMLNIASTVFTQQPSVPLLSKLREYHSAALLEQKNNANAPGDQSGDNENEQLSIVDDKPLSEQLPTFDKLVDKLLANISDEHMGLKLDLLASERLLTTALHLLQAKKQLFSSFIARCVIHGVEQQQLLGAGFVPLIQTVAAAQYVPTNTILLNNLSDADPLLKPLQYYPCLWFVASLCKITNLFHLNLATQNKFLIQMFTWLKISRKFLHEKQLLDEWDYMLYTIYALGDSHIKAAIRADVQLRTQKGAVPDVPPALSYLPPPPAASNLTVVPQIAPQQGVLGKGMLTRACNKCRTLLSFPSEASQIECPQCKHRMYL